MIATVGALLEKLIDYAGMFPPARLPMDAALRQYARLAETPDAWMLGRFVCQASRLGELQELARADGAPRPLRVAALGRGGQDAGEFRNNLDADLDAIARFNHEFRAQGQAEVLEVAVPSARPAEELAQVVGYVVSRVTMATFLEGPLGPAWQADVQTLCQRIGEMDRSALPYRPGLKVRCGGAVVPSVEQIAFFIVRCREHRLAWKATAGLHHPLRHRDPVQQTMVHGFLNVFLAGVFAHVHGLDETQLSAMLQEESAQAFRFADERIGWRDWSCTLEQVREARTWLPSFGSCSFDEPRDDLRALGLLPLAS